LADLVATKHRLGDSEHARQTLAKAEKGYSDVARLFAATKDLSPDIHQEIQSGLKRLRERLDGLQRSNRQIRLNPASLRIDLMLLRLAATPS
jgi:hypothetical protein